MAAGRSFADHVKRKCNNGLFSAAEVWTLDSDSKGGWTMMRILTANA